MENDSCVQHFDFYGKAYWEQCKVGDYNYVTTTGRKVPVCVKPDSTATIFGGDMNLYDAFVEQNLTYPTEKMEWVGNIVVALLVDENGNALDPRILKGCAEQAYMDSALAMVSKLPKFKPAVCSGRKQKCVHFVTVRFK